MANVKKKEIWDRIKKQKFGVWVAVAMLILFLVSVFPIVYISRYNVPSADDCAGAYQMHEAVKNSQSILKAAWDHMYTDYLTLQGTFTAGFFGAFCPMAFHSLAYFFVPFFLIGLLCLSLFYCFWQILVRFLKFDFPAMICIWVLVASAMIQYLPSAVEGFFWWSGGFLYTGLFSLALFAIGSAVGCMISKQTNRLKMWVSVFGTGVLLFLTGGGNFPTALATTIVIVYLLAYIVVSRQKRISVFLMLTVASGGGLLLNVLAPSNLARLEREMGETVYKGTVARTIELSFRFGFQFARTWTTLPIIVLMIVCVPFAYHGLKNCKFRFRYPLVFFILSFCVYCAMFAPVAHSYGWIGPQRYMNIVYFGYIFVCFGNVVYVTGWLRRNIREFCEKEQINETAMFDRFEQKHKKTVVCVFVWGIVATAIGTQQNFFVNETITYNQYLSTAQKAVLSLKDNTAQTYYHEYRARLTQLEDPTIKDVVFMPYTYKPELLYFDDITPDKNDWRNQLMKTYYEKDSVVLQETNS